MDKTPIYIIGPRKNWEIKRWQFIFLSVLCGSLFLAMVVFLVYETVSSLWLTRQWENQHQSFLQKNQELQDNLLQLQRVKDQEVATLKQELTDKTHLLNQRLEKEAANEDSLKNTKEGHVIKLNGQLELANKQIEELNLQNKDLQQQLTEIREKNFPLTANHKNIEVSAETEGNKIVAIEQLQVSNTPNRMNVQFNLANKTEAGLSGFIRILAMTKTAKDPGPQLDRKIATPFYTKRFRPFSKEFDNPQNQTLDALRITIWDVNGKLIHDHNIPLDLVN